MKGMKGQNNKLNPGNADTMLENLDHPFVIQSQTIKLR